jgi:outer membrane protein OmpA-like peptidoglycan-associated protein
MSAPTQLPQSLARSLQLDLRRYSVQAACCAFALTLVTGCSTKKYVQSQTAPVIQKTNELDDQTAANNRSLQDLDKKTSAGIGQAQTSATNAQQAANSASQSATQAQQSAQDAVNRADSLSSVVANLDSYQKVSDISVYFGFNKSVLTKDAKQTLDGLGSQLAAQKSYILQLTGGTDSVGSAQYNYELSDKRAQAVVQYLATKYNVPAHRFYLIGLGKDEAVAPNANAAGRAKNRRVEVQLLSNQTGAPVQTPGQTTGQLAPGAAPAPSSNQ